MECSHTVLTLLPPPPPRMRCTTCHLTLTRDELHGGPCPECAEAGRRSYDFEPVPERAEHPSVYRCDECGLLTPAA